MRLITAVVVLLSLVACGHSAAAPHTSATVSSIPDEGPFMTRALNSYAGLYWARVSGRDTRLPPHVNGHDEFAARWSREVLADLHGLHAAVIPQPFHTPGFRKLPASLPGVNIVIAVPGSKYPNQAVVVGTHYDGEPFSKGSANDDASGSIITLALARVMGQVWRAHGPPDRTVEFVLFDAEEQGLVGSVNYTFASQHGALMPRPVFMIDEEQSGVAYPVRPFGLQSLDPLPGWAATVGGHTHPIDPAKTSLLLDRLKKARSEVFAQLHAIYSPLPYRGGSAPAFTPADQKYLEIGPSDECCSDNDPFQTIGVPNITFSGNYDFYSSDAEPWSYPFDQPWDTFTALACDTGGKPKASRALQAALDLPLALSAVLLQQYAPSARGVGVALFSTLAERGKPAGFLATTTAKAHWSFGDGASATGASVAHTYRRAGTYLVRAQAGSTTTTASITVAAHHLTPKLPFGKVAPPKVRPWHPLELANIPGCR